MKEFDNAKNMAATIYSNNNMISTFSFLDTIRRNYLEKKCYQKMNAHY